MKSNEYATMAAVEAKHWWYQHLHEQIEQRLRHLALEKGHPIDIFDAGCGTGGMLKRLKSCNLIQSAQGCEPHPWAYAHCLNNGLEISQTKIEELNLGRRYDAVLCLDVLYHKHVNPDQAIAVLSSLTKQGGRLLINVAAMPCLTRQHDRQVMGARRFLPQDLKRLCERHGLELLELRYWNSLLTPLLWLHIRLSRVARQLAGLLPTKLLDQMGSSSEGQSDLYLPPKGLNNLLRLLLHLETTHLASLPMPFGSSLLLVAQPTV